MDNRKKVFTHILLYIVIIIIFLDSTTMYRFLTDSPFYGKGFGVILGIFCILYVLLSKTFYISISYIIRFVLIAIYLLAYAILSNYKPDLFLKSFAGTFLIFSVFVYFLYHNGDYEYFLKAFSNVMIVVCCLSLIFWFFGSILNIMPGRTAKEYYWADHYRRTYTYFHLYFENEDQNRAYSIVRNLGIFAEAPGFSGFLTYDLLIEMVLKKAKKNVNNRISVIRIAIIAVTLLSTSSTKGVLALIIAFMIKYLSVQTKDNFKYFVKLVIGIIACVAAGHVGSTLIEGKLATRSGIIRMDDLTAGLKTFLNHPLLGVGFRNVDGIQAYQLVDRSNNGLSMGIATLLAFGGIWLTSFYLLAIFLSKKIPFFRDNPDSWYLVVVLLVYNLFVSNSGFSDVYLLLLASVYSYTKRNLGWNP